MGTTILRFAKIKNVANIRQAGAHQHRHHKNTPNANPQLNKLNRYFHGTNNLAADVKGRLEILDKEPRKNSVLAMEGLLQLSPELIKPDGKEDIEVLREWYKQSKEWLNKEFGDNLVNAVLHRDEETPHIHFVVVPVVERDGRHSLSARDMFGKAQLARMQRSYYASMEGRIANIEPPKHGSKRKHTEVKHFYEVLDQVKADLHVAADNMLEQLKNECMDTLKGKYLPLVDRAVEKVESELEGRLTEEVKAKIKESYKQELDKEIDAFRSTPTLKGMEERVTQSIDKAKVKVGKEGEKHVASFSFKP